MKPETLVAWISALCLLVAAPAFAQQKSAPVQQPSAQDSLWAQIEKLDWKLGPTQGSIASVATITVPKGSAFLASAGSRRFLELQGNPGADGRYAGQ